MTDPRGLVPGAALNLGPFGIFQPTVSTDSAVHIQNVKVAVVLLLWRSPELDLCSFESQEKS